MIQGVYKEHPYRPGVMEFDIQDVILLDDVKKRFTKRVQMLVPLEKVNGELVEFLGMNLRANPGNTELRIQVQDNTAEMAAALKTGGQKIAINDELVHFVEEHDYIRMYVETQ